MVIAIGEKKKGRGFGMTVSAPVELSGMSRAGSEQKDITRLIVATSIGNALEWYDIAVYAILPCIFQRHFFPSDDPNDVTASDFVHSDCHSHSAYWRRRAWRLCRPLRPQGVVDDFHRADDGWHAGGCFHPAYGTIGILAPIAVLTARWCKDFRRVVNSEVRQHFLVEHAPRPPRVHRKLAICQPGAKRLLASAFGIGLTAWMTPAEMQAWGWRIPFLFGVLVGPVASTSATT